MIKNFLPFLGHGDSYFNVFGHPYFIARSSLRVNLRTLISDSIYEAILDIGCGTAPYRDLFPLANQYHGLEIDQPRNHSNPNATFFYDGLTIPLRDNTYDAILCSQVLEHSFNPEQLLLESLRILKPGGVLFLSIPFFWPEHEQPYDSQRFTMYGLMNRLEKSGFELIMIRKSNVGLSALLQLLIEWVESIVRRSFTTSPYLFLLWRCISSVPYSIINFAALLSGLFVGVSSSNELYLDLVVSARKPH